MHGKHRYGKCSLVSGRHGRTERGAAEASRSLHAILAAADRVIASGGVQASTSARRCEALTARELEIVIPTAQGTAMAPSFWEGVHPGRCA